MGVVWWVCKPILVFSLSQAEQLSRRENGLAKQGPKPQLQNADRSPNAGTGILVNVNLDRH